MGESILPSLHVGSSHPAPRLRVLIATTPHDLRFCRICLASVRYFHPEAEIALLPGEPLPEAFLHEAERHFGASLYPVEPGNYGWGFVKLEPLFGPPGDPFLILDADTVMTGPLLDTLNARLAVHEPPAFLVDDEQQPEAEMRRLYYDWDRVRDVDANARRPDFVFNSGQWVGTPGTLNREDFDQWVDRRFPCKQRLPDCFHNGEQGILNYILNQGHQTGRFRVDRLPLMRWPGHGVEGLSAEAVRRGDAPARIVHWAGLKRLRLRDMPGADLLDHFERMYYQAIPGGESLRRRRAFANTVRQIATRAQTWLRLFLKKIRSKSEPEGRSSS